jgi:hypothetical protein
MTRRDLLKAAVLASAGLAATGKTVLAAASDSNGGKAAPEKTGSAILTKKRTLGRGDAALTVSALSLGCMGMQVGRGLVPDEKSMERLILQAYDRGCDFFDTAEGYAAGRNEELLGRAIAPIRDKVIIGTKFTVDLTKNPPITDNLDGLMYACCDHVPAVRVNT